MKTSRMLVAASCAALLLNGASAAFAQRGGGGRGGGGGGFHGGMGMSRGGATTMMGHGGFRGSPRPIGTNGFRGVQRGPFVNGGVVRGGVVNGGNFRYGGNYYRNGGNYYRYGGNYGRHGAFVYGHGYNHGFVGPAHFYRPYYAFRPNVSIGFGLWAGYPFAYPYAFYNPYYYSYYPYSSNNYYPPPGSVSSDVYASSSGAVIDQANTGGMSFEITPNDAELFVDNVRVGTVGEFTSTTQPLGLAAGRHHVEIRAAGYRTISFDVDIIAGQVLPYQGSLER